jgi:hypothetical protein
MSVFRGTIRPPAILSDEAVERHVETVLAELAPDPLFRRRLRGEVMNRYVTTREGLATAPQRRSMGGLGRAVLYASFTLALSATSVLAVSQEALPGDLLYPLKRQVESLRFEVLPAHLHHDLAAYELAERIDELARLTEVGDSTRAASMAAVVAHDYEAFVAEADAAGLVPDDRYLTVLTALLERLPADVPAIDAIQNVVDRAPSHGGGAPQERGSSGTNGGGITTAPGANGHGTSDPANSEPTPKPKATKSPKPEPTPRAPRAPNASDHRPTGGHPGSSPAGAPNAGKEYEDQ